MAEDTDPESKTEDPTSKRISDARAKGDVAKTMDLPQWASLSAVTAVVLMSGGYLAQNLMTGLTPFIAHPDEFTLQNNGALQVARQALNAAMPIMVAVLVAAALAGVVGNVIQTGLIWAPEKLKPDLSKLSPFGGFKRVFGLDPLVNFGKSLIKATVIGAICWSTLAPHHRDLEGLTMAEPAQMLTFTMAVLKALFLSVLGAMGVGAIADWLWQRHRFIQRLRMSREEIKDEHKQSDGDPHVRARQKAIRMERAKRRMMKEVPTATVVVMNPTHFAVALRYDDETPAPLCVAKGVDSLALKIREVAEAAGVPIVEDPPLARALFAAVELDQTIPRQHYEAVAKVIGFVMSAARKRRARPLR
jgi:flagellar biosynthetic protein FlhB